MKINMLTTRAASILSGIQMAAILSLLATTAAATPDADAVCKGKSTAEAVKYCAVNLDNTNPATIVENPSRRACTQGLQDILNEAKTSGSAAEKKVAQAQNAALGKVIANATSVSTSMIEAVCGLYKPAPVNPAPVNPAPVNPAPVNPAPVNPAPVNPAPAPTKCPAPAPGQFEAKRNEQTKAARQWISKSTAWVESTAKFEVAGTRALEAIQDFEKQLTTLEKITDPGAYPDECGATIAAQNLAHDFVVNVPTLNAEVKKICNAHCSAPDFFCIEATTGSPFCRNTAGIQTYDLPRKINGGDKITGQVWGPSGVGAEGTADLSSAERVSRNSPFAAGLSAGKAGGPLGPNANNLPSFVKLVEKSITVSTNANVQSVTIAYTWTPNAASPLLPVQRDYVITVDQGKYFLEIGLLLPLVINGTRTVTPSLVPGTGGDRRIRITEDSVVTPALALNFFPAGRRNGRVTAFEPCRAGDLLGMQIAVDINLKEPFERIYGGFVFEPITGFSLDAGLAMVKGDVIPPEYAEAMLVPKGETFTPDRRYFPRPYFGLTLTNEIVTAITGTAQKIKNASQN
jgi:hypothetical protein